MIGPLIAHAAPGTSIRCWVPGCATGEEAYTLAILLKEEMERCGVEHGLTIFATDTDEAALRVARDGRYPSRIRDDLSQARLRRWFRPDDDHYRVVPTLRDCLIFATHSLQRDPPFARQHLIACRGLLIDLAPEQQTAVMASFRHACHDDGYLFLDHSETARAEHFRALDPVHRLYQAVAETSGRRETRPDTPTTVYRTPPGREQRSRQSKPDSPAAIHQRLLEAQAPPSILVDVNGEILHLSETAGRFLLPPGGPISRAILELVRAELRDQVGMALRHAFDSGEPWLSESVPVPMSGVPRRVAVLARPQAEDGQPTRALLLLLEGEALDSEHEPPYKARERALLERLYQAEQQILHLRVAHQSAEEDLRATNEELQSLNEELETRKDELQGVNEELMTLNLELGSKLEEITQARDDLENLMAATDIATLFLDRQLRIKRFTPRLGEVFDIRMRDIGRPIGDIRHGLVYERLEQDARTVLADRVPLEREVTAHDARAFILKLRPYRTAEGSSDGLVVTLFDVTQLKHTETGLREARAALETKQATLEERVAARTAALRRSEAQLHALAARLEAVREEERTRLAREVHDVLGQLLTALTMDMAWLRRRLSKVADAEPRAALTDKLHDMGQLTEGMIRSVQEITSDLRPTVLDNLGLDAAIRFEAERFQRRTEIRCVLDLHSPLPSLTTEQSTAMFRILQETLTNVARHAEASRVEIRLRADAASVRLEVADDGRGITPAELNDSRSLGLASMRERAAQLGGRLDIAGGPGEGTRLVLGVAL